MSDYLLASIALAVVVGAFTLAGGFDVFEAALTQPSEVSARKLEDLCIAGNANACKMYEIRFEKRCTL